MLEIILGHLIDRVRTPRPLREIARLQTVDRMLRRNMPDQLGIRPAEAAGIVNAEQRQFASDRPDRQQNLEVRQGGPAADQTLGQRLDGRRLEQAADADIGIHAGADPADQPDRQQRMAAQFEEVVVDADPLDAEHLGKQSAEDLLLRRARRAARMRWRRLGRRQRAAVELAVRRQRQLVESHDRRRHHVVGQAGSRGARAAPPAQCSGRPAPHKPPAACVPAHPRGRSPPPAPRCPAAAAPPRSRPARSGARGA